ncbi:N-acetylmuramoyl-L-alanine amidase [Akkermansia massiliensis]
MFGRLAPACRQLQDSERSPRAAHHVPDVPGSAHQPRFHVPALPRAARLPFHASALHHHPQHGQPHGRRRGACPCAEKGAMGSLNWHFTVDQYRAIQHIPLNETGRHADRGGPGDMYSIGIEMGEVRSHNPIVTWNRSAKLTAVLMKQYNIPLRNVVPHYYWTGKNCPAPLLTNGRPGHKWSWFVSRVDYYRRCLETRPAAAL